MSGHPVTCIECSAELAREGERCPRCGARQTPAPQWRRALVSAGVTTAISVLALGIGYERMRNDAEADAKSAVARAAVRPAAASDRAALSAAQKPPAAARLAARTSR